MVDARFQNGWLQESFTYAVAENKKNISFQYFPPECRSSKMVTRLCQSEALLIRGESSQNGKWVESRDIIHSATIITTMMAMSMKMMIMELLLSHKNSGNSASSSIVLQLTKVDHRAWSSSLWSSSPKIKSSVSELIQWRSGRPGLAAAGAR